MLDLTVREGRREIAKDTVRRLVDSEVGHGHPDVGRLFTTVGEMKIALEPAWLMIQKAACTGPVGSFARTWALAEAKYVVGETAARVSAQAMRVAGAKSLLDLTTVMVTLIYHGPAVV